MRPIDGSRALVTEMAKETKERPDAVSRVLVRWLPPEPPGKPCRLIDQRPSTATVPLVLCCLCIERLCGDCEDTRPKDGCPVYRSYYGVSRNTYG